MVIGLSYQIDALLLDDSARPEEVCSPIKDPESACQVTGVLAQHNRLCTCDLCSVQRKPEQFAGGKRLVECLEPR